MFINENKFDKFKDVEKHLSFFSNADLINVYYKNKFSPFKHNFSSWNDIYSFLFKDFDESFNHFKSVYSGNKHSRYLDDRHLEESFFIRGIDQDITKIFKTITKSAMIAEFLLDIYEFRLKFDYTKIFELWNKEVNDKHLYADKELLAIKYIIDSTKKEVSEAYDFYDYLNEIMKFSRKINYDFMFFINRNHLRSGHSYGNQFLTGFREDSFNSYNNNSRMPFEPSINNSSKNYMITEFIRNYQSTIEELDAFVYKYEPLYKTNSFEKIFNYDEIKKNHKIVASESIKLCAKTKYYKNDFTESSKNTESLAYSFVENKEMYSKYLNGDKENILMMAIDTTIFETAIVFEDSSIAYKLKGLDNFEVLFDYSKYSSVISDIYKSNVKYALRKNPTIMKFILETYDTNLKKFDGHRSFHAGIQVCLNSYFKNEGILKSHNYNFIESFKKHKNFEMIDDEIHRLVRDHKILQYANSIVSNKYKTLYNDRTFELFKELFDMNISKHIIQDMIGKKIAAIKTTGNFNKMLKSLITSLNDFEIDKILLKAKAKNAKIISDSDNILILEISNFEQSKVLGSSSWCISRDKYHFDNYVKDCNYKQLFIYNFNKTSKEVGSMIGLTIDKKYKVTAGHTKNDGIFKDSKMLEYILDKLPKIDVSK